MGKMLVYFSLAGSWIEPLAPSLRGLSPKVTGGVS